VGTLIKSILYIADARILLEVDADADADAETALADARLALLDGEQDAPNMDGEQDAPNMDVNVSQALAGTPSAWRDQIAYKMWTDYTHAE
jgi:hypothetical protein